MRQSCNDFDRLKSRKNWRSLLFFVDVRLNHGQGLDEVRLELGERLMQVNQKQLFQILSAVFSIDLALLSVVELECILAHL